MKEKENNPECLGDNDAKDEKEALRKDIKVRLRRIEGQVKGIEKMMDSNACCRDVLIQIAAIRAAINKVGGIVIENYAKECFIKENGTSIEDQKIEDLVSTLIMFLK